MKINKPVFINFNSSSNGSAYINVNFPVKSIHIKSAVYQSGGIVAGGDERYLTLLSDLTDNQPLGQIYNDTRKAPANQFCDISFQPSNSKTINGLYNFTLLNKDGSAFTTPSNDWISLILEFNGIDTADT